MNIRFSAILKPVAYQLQGNQLTLEDDSKKFMYLYHVKQAAIAAGEKADDLSSAKVTLHANLQQFELNPGENRNVVVTGADLEALNAKRQETGMFFGGPIWQRLRDLKNVWNPLHTELRAKLEQEKPPAFGFQEIDTAAEQKQPVNQVQTALFKLEDEYIRMEYQETFRLENEFLAQNQHKIEETYFLNGQPVEKPAIEALKPLLKKPE